ncbi:hypothetical protein [Streptomyces sp. CA-106131]
MAKAWVNAGCKAQVIEHAAALGVDVEVVSRDGEQNGIVVQKVCWRV